MASHEALELLVIVHLFTTFAALRLCMKKMICGYVKSGTPNTLRASPHLYSWEKTDDLLPYLSMLCSFFHCNYKRSWRKRQKCGDDTEHQCTCICLRIMLKLHITLWKMAGHSCPSLKCRQMCDRCPHSATWKKIYEEVNTPKHLDQSRVT